MKISDLMKREDFYKINKETLDAFFSKTPNILKNNNLYVYPKINAIIPIFPSKEVKCFLYTEFDINGNIFKKLLVYLYIRLALNSFGILADKKLLLQSDQNIDKYNLIYPCNKKYRFFNFKNSTVIVFIKSGYNTSSIQKEINFRKGKQLDFVLPILENGDDWYIEHIISGKPLARIKRRYFEYCAKALCIWESYNSKYLEEIKLLDYADVLYEKINQLSSLVKTSKNEVNIRNLDVLSLDIKNRINRCENITIETVMSHGDFQSGNIWIEDRTRKIYIIDWESCERRSLWYDRAVLYFDLRRNQKLQLFLNTKCKTMLKYFGEFDSETVKMIVTFEDIIFQMNSLIDLPYTYGIEGFNIYIQNLLKTNIEGSKNV